MTGPAPILLPYQGVHPRIAADTFIAPGAVIIGDVEIGPESSIWFGCVLRGDVHHIRVGARTNIQDGTIVHVTRTGIPTLLGSGVTVGHGCILHACTLEDDAFVGMGAVLMDRVVLEGGAMVAAGALVPPGKRIRRGELWAGCPARPTRSLSDAERAEFKEIARHYAGLAAEYREALL